MSNRIYLDQNIISALRENIESKETWAIPLKSLLIANKYKIHYSNITLNEIDKIQIKNNKHKFLQILNDLGAEFCFIYENTERMGTDDKSVFEIWEEYHSHKNILEENGTSKVIDESIEFLKIITGSNVGKDLLEGITDFSDNINQFLYRSSDQLKEYSHILSDNLKTFIEKPYPITINGYDHLKNIDHQKLHPENIRKIQEIRDLKVNTLPPKLIIDSIRPYITPLLFGVRKCEQVRIIYHFLNVLGFYNDDYTSKGGKRLVASLNDMEHVVHSIYLDSLITSDANLKMKAKAIYYALNLNTKVYSPIEFLSLHV